MNLKGKKVLIRIGINSPVINRKVFLNDRLIEHAKTLKWLSKSGARVAAISHQGRKGGSDFISLREHAKLLSKYLKLKFVNDLFGEKAVNAISNLKNGDVILLENVRFYDEEYKPSVNNKFVKNLAPLFDVYINDALSDSLHENQTSVISFPKVLRSFKGPFMIEELKKLDKVKKEKGFLYVVGGKKIDEVLLILDSASKNKSLSKVIVTGYPAFMFFFAMGFKLGKQEEKLDANKLSEWKKLLDELDDKLILPFDFVDEDGKIVKTFPVKKLLPDIGPESCKEFSGIIQKSKKIIVKGTPGMYEIKKFRNGTKSILNAAAGSKSFSVVLGGDTTSAMKLLNINKNKFSFVSLSGGAGLAYLAGEKLKGLEVLKK